MPTVPENPPGTCPVCGAEYDSVSAHTEGVVVGLNDNDRYPRVCFDPVDCGGSPGLHFYHHTHEQVE